MGALPVPRQLLPRSFSLAMRQAPDWADVRQRSLLGCSSTGSCTEDLLTEEMRHFVKDVPGARQDDRAPEGVGARGPPDAVAATIRYTGPRTCFRSAFLDNN